MTDLLNQIRAAQVRAAEDVVVANLQSMGLASESPRPALTSREITAMTAHAAVIKAANARHSAEPWYGSADAGNWSVSFDGFGTSCYRAIRDADNQIVAFAVAQDPEPFADSDCRDNLRRIVACVNACQGIPTETLESCAHWSDIVSAPLNHRQHIPSEAAAIGAVLDGESLEQGEPA